MDIPLALPREPSYFVERLAALHDEMVERLYGIGASESTEALAAVAEAREGDTIFAIDVHAEEVLDAYFSAWGEELPLLLVAEGFPGDGGKTYPPGTAREDVAFTCIVDPIDGTRGLMYQKRSAWILSGIAPAPGDGLLGLDSIGVAMQTELPTNRSRLSDRFWAVRGRGVQADTRDVETGSIRSTQPRPSRSQSLLYGFGTIVKFFPGSKVRAAEIEERLVVDLFGPPLDGNPQVFDDEYISSGGQLYELMTGHDRFIADLRPLLLAGTASATEIHRICAHPYDLCTELIAREAGVIVTDGRGEPLRYPLDVRVDCSWIGYANGALRRQIEPRLQAILQDMHF